jgi:hypothetical protein
MMDDLLTLTDPCPHNLDRVWCEECDRIAVLTEELISYVIGTIMQENWDEFLTMDQFYDGDGPDGKNSIVQILARANASEIDAMLSLLDGSRRHAALFTSSTQLK